MLTKFAGPIFKRFDPMKLFIMVGQDITKRYHLLLTMLFVAFDEMDKSGYQPTLDASVNLQGPLICVLIHPILVGQDVTGFFISCSQWTPRWSRNGQQRVSANH